MEGGGFWRLVAIIVVAYLAIRLVLFLLHWALGLLQIGITLAIVVGIIWLLVQIFGKKKAYL